MAAHSPNVCLACKLRKKSCDKALPACGFCSARRLSCRYDINRRDKSRRVYNPGKHFVPLPPTPPLLDSFPHAEHGIGRPAAFIPSDECHQRVAGNTVAEEAQQILASLDVSRDRLRYQYFSRCNEWLPIISPSFFDTLEPNYLRNTLQADVSVLLLCIHFAISVSGSRNRLNETTYVRNRRSIYGTIKALISRVEAQICASLLLVQATLLLAECEYACIRAKNAYVTLARGAAMSKILGLQNESESAMSTKCLNDPNPDRGESVNIAWALAMMDRIILAELNFEAQLQLPALSHKNTSLPPSMLQGQRGFNEHTNRVISDDSDADHIDEAGRQAQAIILLDEVLRFTAVAASAPGMCLVRHADLDAKVRSFLALLFDQTDDKNASRATLSVALCIRSLFLLHKSLLGHLKQTETEAARKAKHIAQASLDTVCAMITDIARVDGPPAAGALPLCCYYNMVQGLEYMRERNAVEHMDKFSADIDTLMYCSAKYESGCSLWEV